MGVQTNWNFRQTNWNFMVVYTLQKKHAFAVLKCQKNGPLDQSETNRGRRAPTYALDVLKLCGFLCRPRYECRRAGGCGRGYGCRCYQHGAVLLERCRLPEVVFFPPLIGLCRCCAHVSQRTQKLSDVHISVIRGHKRNKGVPKRAPGQQWVHAWGNRVAS